MRVIIGALHVLHEGITDDWSAKKVETMEKCLTAVYEREAGEGITFDDGAYELEESKSISGLAEYIRFEDCIATPQHLTICDDDGYCIFCGHQEHH